MDEDCLRAKLGEFGPRVRVENCVDSTNSALLSHLESHSPPQVLIAREQRMGRGRRGRVWHSPKGGGLYLSYAHHSHRQASQLTALSLVVAVSVSRCLPEHVCIKWPNDWVVHQDGGLAKVGGCLVETHLGSSSPHLAIIGIGLNVNLTHALTREGLPQPNQAYADLSLDADPETWTASLIAQLHQDLANFEVSGFESFQSDWSSRHLLQGLEVVANGQDQAPIHGIAGEVNSQGQLCMETPSGLIWLNSAEITVRQR